MADITLNSAVRSNLRTLQSTTDFMNRTEERLSTGKKVNSAFDNPGAFFTSQALDRRASDITSLLDSVSSSVKTLQAADNGISAITKVVESLKATARSALQSQSPVTTKSSVESASVAGLTAGNIIGTGGGATAGAVSFTFGGPTTFGPGQEIQFDLDVDGALYVGPSFRDFEVSQYGNFDNVIDSAAEFRELLTGYFAPLDLTIGGAGNEITVTSNSTGASSSIGVLNYTTTGGLVNNTGFGNASGTGTAGGAAGNEGKTLTVKDRSGADKTVTLAASGVNTLDKLNAWFEANDVALQASVTSSGGSGKLKLESANSAANLTPADIAGTIGDAGGSFSADKTFSAPVLDLKAAAKRASFVKDYNDALKQISTLAKDASFNGVNLLSGDTLDIVFNEDGSSVMNVKGVTFDAAGLGFGDLADADFYDAESINEAIAGIDSAFATLEQQASKFGSQLQIVNTRESFAKDMIGTLEDGSSALTAADTNAEAANLATLQTRQQLIVSALSISTSQEQNILQLLR